VINLSGDRTACCASVSRFEAWRTAGSFGCGAAGRSSVRDKKEHGIVGGCIAGALQEPNRGKAGCAGFDGIEVEPTRVYQVEEAREFLQAAGFDAEKGWPAN